MYNILIVGAGYLGTGIAREFKSKKQRVFALTRNVQKAAAFESEGIHPVIADLTQPETLTSIPPAHFIVLCAAPDENSAEKYRSLYLEGIKNFLTMISKKQRPYLILQISSTSVWKEREGSWVDESTPADADSEKGKILIASENLVLQSGYPCAIYRLSGIYGPARNRLKSFQSGLWPAPNEKEGYMNMIHVHDAVRSVQILFKKAEDRSIYIGTDDEPVLRSDFVKWLSEQTHSYPSASIQTGRIQGKRCHNNRLKGLGFEFQYPNFRIGYQNLISER